MPEHTPATDPVIITPSTSAPTVVVPGPDRLARIYRDLQGLQDNYPVDIGPALDAIDQLCRDLGLPQGDPTGMSTLTSTLPDTDA